MKDDKATSTTPARANVLNGIYEDIVATATDTALRQMQEARDHGFEPDPQDVRATIIGQVNEDLTAENAGRGSRQQLPYMKELDLAQVTKILMWRYRWVRVIAKGSADPSTDLLARYCPDGEDEGIYVSDDKAVRAIARGYRASTTIKDGNELVEALRDLAPRVSRCLDRDLIAVNNGILDYRTKELRPFDPELVFLSKSGTDWDPDAENPKITMPDGETWDVLSWIDGLFDDPALSKLMTQVFGAVLRPNVRWDKVVMPIATSGNNGKGTCVQTMRNLLGDRAHCSIPIAEFDKEFALSPLIRASAVLVDENDVGGYLEKAGNFKTAITWDLLPINRKFESVVNIQFRGLMVQCMNEKPRFRDKSGSIYRRQLPIPFAKSYEGVERRYIKDDYLARPDVLRYLLKHVMTEVEDFYEFDIPQACLDMLEDFKETNDPVRAFWNECSSQWIVRAGSTWRGWWFIPSQRVYDVFVAWCGANGVDTKGYTKRKVLDEIREIVKVDGTWLDYTGTTVPTSPTMVSAPPFLSELRGSLPWMAPVSHIRNGVAMVDATAAPDKTRGFLHSAFADLVEQTGSYEKAAAAIELSPLVVQDAALDEDPYATLAGSAAIAAIEDTAKAGIVDALRSA